MTKLKISDLLGINTSTLSHYWSKGVCPPPPDGFKKMEYRELKDYIDSTKVIVEDYRSKVRTYTVNNVVRDWSLPPELARLEKEYKSYA